MVYSGPRLGPVSDHYNVTRLRDLNRALRVLQVNPAARDGGQVRTYVADADQGGGTLSDQVGIHAPGPDESRQICYFPDGPAGLGRASVTDCQGREREGSPAERCAGCAQITLGDCHPLQPQLGIIRRIPNPARRIEVATGGEQRPDRYCGGMDTVLRV
jgi:hypothetical protein